MTNSGPSCLPGQVDYPSGQVRFYSYLPDGQARDQASHLSTESLKEQTKACPGKAISERYLS